MGALETDKYENAVGGIRRGAGLATEQMLGCQRLWFLDDNHNGRKHIMTKDRAYIDMDSGTEMKQELYLRENEGEELYGQRVEGVTV